uniref:Apple domain-containing protein n=1 Tax=Chlamydomonas euryale TaxID=1486919 RepID=A0A6U2IG63_9CHLO|mmetsp:Transcript_42852/g.128628  ORF Transcript_42852/g.128628 Transcript_42852/m.128628 type:complete len:242 (+) Transcript_42852:167-892(+)
MLPRGGEARRSPLAVAGMLAGAVAVFLLIALVSNGLSVPRQPAVEKLHANKAQGHPAADHSMEYSQVTKVDVAHTRGTEPAHSSTTPVTSEAPKKLVVTVLDQDNNSFEIFDEPLPEDCHGQSHFDLDGGAVRWGLGHKAHSAAECCQRCKDYQPSGVERCNVWTWCGDPSGICWTMDIHTHTTGDCWLKYQEHWDNDVNLVSSNLRVNMQGQFPESFRAEHKTAPLWVPWTSGMIPKHKT